MANKQNNWAIRMVTGGPFTEYSTRASARASAKHRSRFDDVAYEVLRRDKTAQGMWILVETQDFHKAIRNAFK
jgi:hypothetical protein